MRQATLFLLLFGSPAFAQVSAPFAFLPFQAGNEWEYMVRRRTYTQGQHPVPPSVPVGTERWTAVGDTAVEGQTYSLVSQERFDVGGGLTSTARCMIAQAMEPGMDSVLRVTFVDVRGRCTALLNDGLRARQNYTLFSLNYVVGSGSFVVGGRLYPARPYLGEYRVDEGARGR